MSIELIPAGKNVNATLSQVDNTTNSLKVIEYGHAELHGGDHYNAKSYELVAKNGTKDILVITPDTTRWAHMLFGVETSGAPISVILYEDTVTSDDGTLDGARNRNRNFPDNNTTNVYEDPTVTDVGTVISRSYLGSGKGDVGATRSTNEVLLKQNTKYLLRMTEQNVTTTVITWVLDWYEHTNS